MRVRRIATVVLILILPIMAGCRGYMDMTQQRNADGTEKRIVDWQIGAEKSHFKAAFPEFTMGAELIEEDWKKVWDDVSTFFSFGWLGLP